MRLLDALKKERERQKDSGYDPKHLEPEMRRTLLELVNIMSDILWADQKGELPQGVNIIVGHDPGKLEDVDRTRIVLDVPHSVVRALQGRPERRP